MAAKGCPCDMRMGAINVGNKLDKDKEKVDKDKEKPLQYPWSPTFTMSGCVRHGRQIDSDLVSVSLPASRIHLRGRSREFCTWFLLSSRSGE
jgi:hypothetical protein